MHLFQEAAVWATLKRLALGIGLILLLSAVLLLSDLGHRNQSSAAPGSATAQKRKVVIVYLARSGAADMCMEGLREGLQSTGFEEGRNLEIRRVDAQGEMINVPAILQNYDNSDVDAILTVSTPCLAGACNTVKHKPVIFTCVSDPLAAGAGKSKDDHLPFLTGVGSFPPVAKSLEMMKKLVPGLRAVGVYYNPAEANSAREIAVAREIYKSRGIRLEEVNVTSSNEILQAVQILAGRDVQAVWSPADNTAIEGYEGAVKGAKDARLPLFTDMCASLSRGGVACMGVNQQDAGLASGKLAGRVLLGADPKNLPIEEVAVERLAISRRNAAQFNITIPPEYSENTIP